MLKQIKQFFKKYNDMAHAVDYLANHMTYHLINTHKIGNNGDTFTMFGREQLHFLVVSRVSLSNKQVDRMVSLAIKNVIASTKASFMVTRNAIYMALL